MERDSVYTVLQRPCEDIYSVVRPGAPVKGPCGQTGPTVPGRPPSRVPPSRLIIGVLGVLCSGLLVAVIWLATLNLPVRPCPKNWEIFRGKCYYISSDSMDVQASQEDCAARGGSLVNIDRKEEQEFLVRKITERGGEWRFWIGLQQTASGEWLWQDYTPLDTMQLWCPGELTTGEEFGSGGDFYSNRHHGYLEAEEDCWGNGFDSSHYRRICERAVQI